MDSFELIGSVQVEDIKKYVCSALSLFFFFLRAESSIYYLCIYFWLRWILAAARGLPLGVVCRLRGCGLWAWLPLWSLVGPGVTPVSCTLAGGFLTNH